MKYILLVFTTIIFSCTNKTETNETTSVKNDTVEVVRSFIYGLWSMDSGNTLYNEGFFFKPDGSVDFIASESSGNWDLSGKDSIKISYAILDDVHESCLKIDSITDGRMILTDEEGTHLFRKVPFGMNNEGNVLQGFAGQLSGGEKKEYTFEIPPAKKISLKLNAPEEISFRVYDRTQELTSIEVREWTSIMIMNGKYKVEVINTSKDKKAVDFDLKVIAY